MEALMREEMSLVFYNGLKSISENKLHIEVLARV
jgi:hypothetical protein